MQNIFIDFLPPWVETGLQPAFYDKESGTVLQQVARMYAKVNQLVKAFDDLDEATVSIVNEYISRFTELKDYVDNYFDNLDVQEEINHKLDEMVLDGTLQDIIDSYLDMLTGKVHYIFPKNWIGYSGDANLIKGYDKNILIDTYRSSNKTDLYDMLDEFNVEHIDYLILTHYHDDHIGNVINLITDGYVDNTSYVYIPPDCQQIIDSPELTAIKNAIIAKLTEYGIPYSIPAENSKLTINDDFDIEFYNTDSATLSTFTNYNNCSTLCKVRHGGKIAYYTGDALGSALNRATTNGFVNSHVDLYKIEHHGIEYSNTINNVLRRILPTYAYQPSFINDHQKNNYSVSTTISYLQTKGCKIYSSHLNSEYIIFESNLNNLTIIQGCESASISNNNHVYDDLVEIFVDANTTNTIQDGRFDTPFKDLSQAIGSCDKLDSGHILILLDEGEYCLAHETDAKNEPRANFVDIAISKLGTADKENVIIKGRCNFANSKITIQNVTFNNKAEVDTCVVFRNCDANITNVDFIGTSATTPTAIYTSDSKINVYNCTFTDYNIGISTHRDYVNSYSNTFTNVTTAHYIRSGTLTTDSNTYTTVTSKVTTADGGANLYNWELLFDGSATSGTLNMLHKITDYNELVVITGAVGSGTLYTDRIMSFVPANFINSTYNFKTLDGYYSGVISDSGSKLTITAHGTSYQVRKIIGIKNHTNL